METLSNIKSVIAEILDIDEQDMNPETYLIRELDAESIDLLELAVSLNSAFRKKINDNDIFLTNLRDHLAASENTGKQPADSLLEAYPFLEKQRVDEILMDLDGGPVLKIKDIVRYIEYV